MKKIGRWAARTLSTALAIVLAIVLLPYAAQMVSQLLPDLGDQALKASVILSQQMEQSARLETTLINEEGAFTSTTDALLIGTVQQVTVHYAYQASLGVDLRKVEMLPKGNKLTIRLPAMEILTDSLTPLTIERDDFWYPLTDGQLQKMLEDEKLARRSAALEEYAASDAAWEQLCSAFDSTVSKWLNGAAGTLQIVYEKAEEK